jgi:hypothetical protein
MMEECVVERQNSRMLTDGSVWFGHKWLATDHSWHRSSLEGAANVKNGHAIQTRLFED